MTKIIIALSLGAIVGIITITPMILRHTARLTVLAVFCQCLIIALVIFLLQWNPDSWLYWTSGIVVGIVGLSPTIIWRRYRKIKSILIILLYGAFIGLVITATADKYHYYKAQEAALFNRSNLHSQITELSQQLDNNIKRYKKHAAGDSRGFKTNVPKDYLIYWKRKIEQIGSADFPIELIKTKTSVTVAVTLKADGAVKEVNII